METFLMRFLVYGFLGLGIEVAWNGTRLSMFGRTADPAMHGHASAWMLFVYGFGFTLGFDAWLAVAGGAPIWLRALCYPLWFWGIEILVGYPMLRFFKTRLWDYTHAHWYIGKRKVPVHWHGLIRFDYAPAWVVFGLLVELLRAGIDPGLSRF